MSRKNPLSKIRQEQDLSIHQLAKSGVMSRPSIQRLEGLERLDSDRPGQRVYLSKLVRYCEALGVKVALELGERRIVLKS